MDIGALLAWGHEPFRFLSAESSEAIWENDELVYSEGFQSLVVESNKSIVL